MGYIHNPEEKWLRSRFIPVLPLGDNRSAITGCDRHTELSRRAACEGAVLLKNDGGFLPLEKGKKVAVFGKAQIDYIKGGSGSGGVHTAYVRNIYEGLKMKQGKVDVFDSLSLFYTDFVVNALKSGERSGMLSEPEIPRELLRAAAEFTDTAIITICRHSGEGFDRHNDGERRYFDLEDGEREMIVEKVWGIIGNVLMWLFIAFAVVITIFAFSAQSSADGVPTIGGKVMSPVLSNSMSPTIKEGDIIFSRKLADEEKTSLKVDDIITFKVDLDGDGTPEVNTHRISEVIGSGSSVTYRTKGDNNAIADTYTISAADVISIFDPAKDTRIPVLGSVIKFLLTPTGFFVVIVIPLIIFFLFEIIMFVRKIMEVKNAGKKQITAEDEELIKQKAIEEYIRSQKAQSGEDNEEPKTEKEAEAPAETTGEEQTKTTEE